MEKTVTVGVTVTNKGGGGGGGDGDGDGGGGGGGGRSVMARGGCWTCTNDSRATQVSAVYGLISGLVWATLALLALLTVRCKLPPLEDSLLFLLYFFNPKCEWEVPKFLQTLQPGWPVIEEGDEVHARPAVQRTLALAAARFSIGATRVIASVLLLVAKHRQSKARTEGRPVPQYFGIYFGWLLILVLDCVLDAIIFAIYVTDIARSKDSRNVLRLLGVSLLAWEDAVLPAWVSDAPAKPPIVMAVVGSRAAPLLWVAETLVAIRVASAARHLHQWSKRKPGLRRAQITRNNEVEPVAVVVARKAEIASGAGTACGDGFPPPPRAPPSTSSNASSPWNVAVVKPTLRETQATVEPSDSLEVAADVHHYEVEPTSPTSTGETKEDWSRRILSFIYRVSRDGGVSWRRWSYLPLVTDPPSPSSLGTPHTRRRCVSQPPERPADPTNNLLL